MRLPSVVTLASHARDAFLRFPWTIAAGVVAAVAAIIATTKTGDDEWWARIAMVAALGLPLTVALTLVAEERGWSRARSAALNAGGIALLLLFYLIWPGPERKHEAVRYFQVSVALHLLVAFMPLLGQAETSAFWQYNRRLFLGFLRATVFSAVLFVGLAIALGALDKLFGVDVPGELYGRLWLLIVFVVNTWIFLTDVPYGLRQLAQDTNYPRVLKVFAQYILTPLVFIYLLLLIAYLIKIVVGGEWPSGWIGWLVASVAVTGLLGFLLVHPLRDDPDEAWIRVYTRWLFIGLIPAAIMLLVAFWKRILPYGLTEPRLLGVLLGSWLLITAIGYTIRQRAGIRLIPLTLAFLLLLTVYGPLSVTSFSVASQARRLGRLVAQRDGEEHAEREASAALRFLLDHGARRQIAAAIPGDLPSVPWDSLPDARDVRDRVATRLLQVAGMRYVSEYDRAGDRYVHLNARANGATPITGYDWMLKISAGDTASKRAGSDTLRVQFDSTTRLALVRVGRDSLRFDFRRLDALVAEYSGQPWRYVPAESLELDGETSGRRGMLALESVNGRRRGNSLMILSWQGTLFLAKRN